VLENRHELHDPASIGAAYRRLATLLSNRLDWYAAYDNASVEDLRSTKIELDTTIRQYETLKTEAAAVRVLAEAGRRNYRRRAVVAGGGAVALTGIAALLWYRPQVFDPRARELVPLRVLGSDAPLTYASFSPDGRQVVTASSDSTARVWEI